MNQQAPTDPQRVPLVELLCSDVDSTPQLKSAIDNALLAAFAAGGPGFIYVRVPERLALAVEATFSLVHRVFDDESAHQCLPAQLLDLATPPSTSRNLLHCTGAILKHVHDICAHEGIGAHPLLHELHQTLSLLWGEAQMVKHKIDVAVARVAKGTSRSQPCQQADSPAETPRGGYIRVMHYVEDTSAAGLLPAHVDPGSWTLLMYPSKQDRSSTSLLEVKDRHSGHWNAISPPHCCAALLPGQLLADISSGVLQGAIHRVVEPPSRQPLGSSVVRSGIGLFSYRYPGADVGPDTPDLDITILDVLAHWRLIVAICARTQDPHDKAYWTPVFKRYAAFLRLQAAEQARSASPRILRPPADLYHCWLVHMLQPKAYKNDCAELVDPSTGWFGTVSHQFNAADLAKLATVQTNGAPDKPPLDIFDFLSQGDAAFREAWLSEYHSEYPALADLGSHDESLLHFNHVDWWKGNDTLEVLVDHVPKNTPEILGSASALAESLQDYQRYLYAALNISEELAPGSAIDLCWHTHQTNPVKYAAHMRRLSDRRPEFFLDHIPCGKENPPQLKWMDASLAAWKELYGTDARLPRGVGARNDIECCCCTMSAPSPAPKPLTPAEIEAQRQAALRRQQDVQLEAERIRGLTPDQQQREIKALKWHHYVGAVQVASLWSLPLPLCVAMLFVLWDAPIGIWGFVMFLGCCACCCAFAIIAGDAPSERDYYQGKYYSYSSPAVRGARLASVTENEVAAPPAAPQVPPRPNESASTEVTDNPLGGSVACTESDDHVDHSSMHATGASYDV